MRFYLFKVAYNAVADYVVQNTPVEEQEVTNE